MLQYKSFYLFFLGLVVNFFIGINLIAPPMLRSYQETSTNSDNSNNNTNSTNTTNSNIPTSSTPDANIQESNQSIPNNNIDIKLIPDFNTTAPISLSDIYKPTDAFQLPHEKILDEYKKQHNEFLEDFYNSHDPIISDECIIGYKPKEIENNINNNDSDNTVNDSTNQEQDANSGPTKDKFEFPEYVECYFSGDSSNNQNNDINYDIPPIINNGDSIDKVANFLENLGIQNRLEKIKNISFSKLVRKVVERSAEQLDDLVNNLYGKEQEVKTEVFKKFARSTLNLIQSKAELGLYGCALEIVQIHENGCKFITGAACEVAVQFWNKIVDSPYETAMVIGLGLAGTIIIPLIAAKMSTVGTGIVLIAGACFIAHECYQKYDNLKEHLQITTNLIASGNNFDAGREVIKGLKAGGELDIIFDAIILGISQKAIQGINILATSALYFGIKNDYKAAINILKGYQYSKGVAIDFKNIGAELINFHTKDVELVTKTVVGLTTEQIKDSIKYAANIAAKCKNSGAVILNNEIVSEIVQVAEQTIKIILGDAPKTAKEATKSIFKAGAKTLDKIIKITIAEVPDLTIDIKNKFSENTNKWIIENKFEPNKFKDFIKMLKAGGIDTTIEKEIIAEIAQANHELAALCSESSIELKFDFFHLIGLDKKNGLHTECIISKIPNSPIKVVPIQQLPGGAYQADVFLNGVKLESRTFTPKSMNFQAIKESMFECIKEIDWNNPPMGKSGDIVHNAITKSGCKVRLIIDPTIKDGAAGSKILKINTYTPICPKKE